MAGSPEAGEADRVEALRISATDTSVRERGGEHLGEQLEACLPG